MLGRGVPQRRPALAGGCRCRLRRAAWHCASLGHAAPWRTDRVGNTATLIGCAALAAITPDDLAGALDALVPWALARRLIEEAPTHFTAPTGSSVPIDYSAEGGPAVSIRVQELFGLTRHPSVAAGRLPLVLHLTSPAGRPVQITRDLPGFWAGSWAEVRAGMRGRYPKHPWPEDPAAAAPTSRAKPRGT